MRRLRLCIALLLAVHALVACERVKSELGIKASRPQDASGPTPIRYVICDPAGHDCWVAARFDNLGSCERHKKMSGALCNSVSVPGKIICDTTHESSLSTAWCLP